MSHVTTSFVLTDEGHHHHQVLAAELSKVDNGAEIYDLSQYPGSQSTKYTFPHLLRLLRRHYGRS